MRKKFERIEILPTDSAKKVNGITKRMGCYKWWYQLPNQEPKPIQKIGRNWVCYIPTIHGLVLERDDEFHTIIEDLRLAGAKIFNSNF